jgi:GntR family transcriptional regulator, rspAB operon transcriptional repressor
MASRRPRSKRQPSKDRRKATKAEKAYEAIKRGILRGEIEEGTFLSESEILRTYGIGRTPYREACNRLHHDQLLEVIPRRGYLVSEISLRSVRELMEVRMMLEGLIAELAATRRTAHEADELAGLGERSWSVAATREYEQVVRTNTDFHLCLARMTHNRELVRLVTGLLERHERLSYLELRTTSIRRAGLEALHRPIIDAIRQRDAKAAREAVLYDIAQGELDIFGTRSNSDHLASHQPDASAVRR